jgi:hypothetical protein
MNSRRHHYLSQFHFMGFTEGKSKKSTLNVCDLKQMKKFIDTPRHVS